MAASITSEFAARLQTLLQDSSRQTDSGGAALLPSAGTVLTGLPVVEHQDSQGTPGRGVLVDGHFFAVELPEDIASGEKVDVKVTLSAGQVKLVFQGRAGQESSATDARQRALEALLKTLDLNQESLTMLRSVLSALPEVSGGPNGGQSLPDALIKFLKQSGVSDLLEFGVDKEFELKKFTRELPAAAGKALIETLKLRQDAAKSGAATSGSETVRRLIRELEAFDLHFEEAQGERTSHPVRPPLVAENRSEVPVREQIKQLAPAFDRILNLLRDKGADTASRPELEAFRRLVVSQLTQLKQVENKVSLLLRDLGGAGTLGDLVTVLDSLRKATEAQPDAISKLLNAFARDLLKGIQGAVSHPDDSNALRTVLEQGLKQLYETFGLVPFEQRILLPEDPASPAIPHVLRGMLRLLESQIVSILADPDIEKNVKDLLNGNSNQLLNRIRIIQTHFEETLKNIPDLGREEMKPLQQKLQGALKVFERLLNPRVATTQEEMVSGATFKEMLVDLNRTIRQFSGFQSGPTNAADNFSGVNSGQSVQKIVRQLERQLLNLLADGNSGAPDFESNTTLERLIDLITGVRNANSAVPNRPVAPGGQQIQNLKLLLQQLMIELPSSGSPVEEQLTSTVFDLGLQLDQHNLQPGVQSPGGLKPKLQQALVKFHQYLEQSGSLAKGEAGLASVDAESLKRAGSVLAAQEALLRMAPIMKTLSEPVLLFFPFVMGNFLSRAQCTFYLEDDSGQEGADRHAASTERFTRLKVVVPFPNIGSLLADVAYRRGEILINLGYENQKVADFVEPRLLQLRQTLLGAGFQKIEIATAMVPAEALVGDHVDAETLRQAFQMSTHL